MVKQIYRLGFMLKREIPHLLFGEVLLQHDIHI